MYRVPAEERAKLITWGAGTDASGRADKLAWWRPAVVEYGGRDDATVVIDSAGWMTVFHGTAVAGTAEAPYAATHPPEPEFFALGNATVLEHFPSPGRSPAAVSHMIRDTGWMVAQVDDQLGLVSAQQAFTWATRWDLAVAMTSIGYFPPLDLGWSGDAGEWRDAVERIGDRAARRVKRALVDRLAEERRALRSLSTRIEAHWR